MGAAQLRALLLSLQALSNPLRLFQYFVFPLKSSIGGFQDGQNRWFRDCRPILLIPYIISIPVKAVGVGEAVKTRSFGDDGKAARTAFPSWLSPYLQEEATLLGIHVVIQNTEGSA